MKYLKLFENHSWDQKPYEEFENFCKMHLAFLSDEGIEVETRNNFNLNRFQFSIKGEEVPFYNNTINLPFNYEDIKDNFIPFMEMLNDRYDIDTIEFFIHPEIGGSKTLWRITLTIEDILNDTVESKLIHNGKLEDEIAIFRVYGMIHHH